MSGWVQIDQNVVVLLHLVVACCVALQLSSKNC
jgi:hypothetical protein